MKFHAAALLVLLTCTTAIKAQLSFGGIPLLPKELLEIEQSVPFINMPVAEITEDATNASPGLKSLRFAHPFFVSLSTDNSGKWSTLADGSKVWRLGIRSAGAYSINLVFDKFALPEGGKLFIFNTDQSTVTGAFTNRSHSGRGVFATTPFPGDAVILEYVQDAGVAAKPVMVIGAVNHDYMNVFGQMALLKAGYFGDSNDCHTDMSCVGGPFPEEKAVCRLVVDGTELCTGTLVNNTRNDGTPFVITSSHCLPTSGTDHAFVALFNYQVPNCQTTIEGYKQQAISGATLVANMPTIDCMLLKFDQTPPNTFLPYWAGWDLNTAPAPPYHAIHHPWGDVKKFARSTTAISNKTFTIPSVSFDADSHWLLPRWLSGTTESGSSGCALFDANGSVLGCLSGGDAVCGNPVRDYFYRLNKAWTYAETADQQLKTWLDPDNTGATQINGLDFYDNNKVQRITNRISGDSAVFQQNNIQWMGINGLGIDAVAERFVNVKECTIQGVYLMLGKVSTTNLCRVKIWSNGLFTEGQNPVVDTLVSLSSLKAPAENLLMLKTPLAVTSPVSVTVEIPSTTFALYYHLGETERTINTAYLRKGGLWYPFQQLHSGAIKTSAYIDLLATGVTTSDTTITEEPLLRVNVYPNPCNTAVTVEWGIDYLKQIDISTLNGQRIFVQDYGFTNGKEPINVSSFPKGVYLLRCHFQGFTKVVKLLVD